MIIIGVDFHPEFQQIASVDTDDRRVPGKTASASRGGGEVLPCSGRARRCASAWKPAGTHAGSSDCVAELQFELWIGDAAEIRTKRVRKQKTDRQDAQLILRLLLEDRFPQIWVPSWENRDLRQLLWHRHRMVQARTRIMNQLQAVALNEGLRCKKRLWRERGRQQLESFRAGSVGEPATARSAGVAGSTEPDDRGAEPGDRAGSREVSGGAAAEDASRSGRVDRAGVRADHRQTRSAFTAASRWRAIWDWCRWKNPAGIAGGWDTSPSKAVRCLRFLLVEAAQVTVRSVPEWRSKYFHLMMRRGRKIAKVAMARRLAVRLYWMMRKGWDYEQLKKFGSHAGQPGNRHGVQSNTE